MKKILYLSFLYSLMLAQVNGQTPYEAIVTKTDRQVIPEGIAINPRDGKIYISSIARKKIIMIDAEGGHLDFMTSGKDGFLEGLGMKIDEETQWLWVVSNQKQGSRYISQVHAYDVNTRNLQQKHVINDTVPHLFNDLILHPNGKVYITDTYRPVLYELDPRIKELSVMVSDSLLVRSNGIANDSKGKIYIATRKGLVQFDPVSKKVSRLTYNDSRTAQWMDGIVYWKNSIIGVADAGIMRYYLSDKRDQIVKEEVIDAGNKYFNGPTTAAIFDKTLYVVANSYLPVYNDNKESVEGIADKLGSVVIVKYSLR